MEEQSIPVLPTAENSGPKKLNFIDLVQESLRNQPDADPRFFSDVINEAKKEKIDIDLTFDEDTKAKIKSQLGENALKQYEGLYNSTLEVNRLSQGQQFYEPLLNDTWAARSLGIKNFRKITPNTDDVQNEFADGFAYPVRIKTEEQIADKAPSIIDYDPFKGFVEIANQGPEQVDDMVSMFGKNKQLTLATNEIVAQTRPEVAQKIKEGLLDAKAPFRDDSGQYMYRTLRPGEKPTGNIRSVWGPESIYHNSYMSELAESMNDFLMDSLDAAMYIQQMPMNMVGKGLKMMGFDALDDFANESFNDYRNWSQGRRSTRSLEDASGAFGSFTNLSKGFVQIAGQILATRGMGLIGGLAGRGASQFAAKYMAQSLSDDVIRSMMSRTALGYNYLYAASAASEEARRNGLSTLEGDLMGMTAGAIIGLTERMTGGQFIDKVLGPVRSKVYANHVVKEISEQARKLGMKPSEIIKDKKTFGGVVGRAMDSTYRWLTETAETRFKNATQGFVGEAFQETSEDGLNMLAQEFRDWMAGEDSYDNTWSSAFHQLSESFALGGLGGAFGGSLFFDKKHWEMSRVDESKYDWLTAAVLKGETKDVRRALDDMHKNGQLGSTLYSAMQNSSVNPTPMSQEKDPMAVSQNELLYQQYKAQLDLVENMANKYRNLMPSMDELGKFIMDITGGKSFIEDSDFADIEKNTAHMMQREAVAMEIKRNHAKNMVALELAKATGGVDLSNIESIHAFNGKLISIKQKDKDTAEVPNVTTANAIQEALRQVDKQEGVMSDLNQAYNEMYQAYQLLEEAEYKLGKNPGNPEYQQQVEQLSAEYQKFQEAFDKLLEDNKLDPSMNNLMDELYHFNKLEKDIKKGERTKFYSHKAILEIAKKKYALWMRGKEGMTVYDFRQKEKDKAYFQESIETENQSNQDLLVQFETLANELAGLQGTQLVNKLNELITLSNSANKLFLTPQTKAMLEQKAKDLAQNNKLTLPVDLSFRNAPAGTPVDEVFLGSLFTLLYNVPNLLDQNGEIDPEILAQKVDLIAASTEEVQAGREPIRLEEFFGMKFTELKGQPLEALLQAITPERSEQIMTALQKMAENGFDYEGFPVAQLQAAMQLLESQELQDFMGNKDLASKIDQASKAPELQDFMAQAMKDIAVTFGQNLDFSIFDGEDQLLAVRAFNENKSNRDNAGASILRKYNELKKQAQSNPEDFIELQPVEKAMDNLMENLVEVILQHEINDWGKENNNEKFTTLFTAMSLVNSELAKLRQLAMTNLNKRSGRDYRVRQGYVNFTANQLIKLNDLLQVLSPEQVKQLQDLRTEAREATNDQEKADINARLEAVIDMEEILSEALTQKLAEENGAREVLDHFELNPKDLIQLNQYNDLQRTGLRELHEDIEDPYDPKNPSSQKEQTLNFLVQLERGKVRKFFNRFNQIVDQDKAKSQDFPSFEQALAARQVFGFLISETPSKIKSAFNAQIDPITTNKGVTEDRVRLDDTQIFVRGIAGAGKSTFVTKLAFDLFSEEMVFQGKKVQAVFTAPNEAQLDVINKTMTSVSQKGVQVKGIDAGSFFAEEANINPDSFGSAKLLVVDEATLMGGALEQLLNKLARYNAKAAPENRIKIVLIGDEYQNGPSNTGLKGIPVFYTLFANSIMERTVPLTSPYRSGNIEAFSMQKTHRALISELQKLSKAMEYKTEYTHPAKQEKTKVDASNWKKLVEEVFEHFNHAKSYTYFEFSPGVIDLGVKSTQNSVEVIEGFAKRLAASVESGSEDQVAMIVENEEDINDMVVKTQQILIGLGKNLTFDQIKQAVYSSRSIQGLSKDHVFVHIDINDALQNSAKPTEVRMVFQSLYVAESRMKKSMTIWHPGKHLSSKTVSPDNILSYPKVDWNRKNEDPLPKELAEVIDENLSLVELIGNLSRPEEAENTTEEIKTEGNMNNQNQNENQVTPPKGNVPPKNNNQNPPDGADNLQNQNNSSNAFDRMNADPDTFFAEADAEFPDIDSVLNSMQNDQDGACTI